ncbi:hypothetical protein LPAF129_09640 [Ligilactobacillus pabuli]|uniref:HTH merR-type domain-containing protein n=1 Tax=Ligilactobacillus pabuli TaxID=2886039 RepID=A0ABQ5JGT8_9LACO|nr:MerR family transcriptional regulator [Ligilactobacillus pabuli]GKS81278.1 hypothetical protein LPAF129_09640 [Ligilactobacillus pabuli]
MDTPKGYAAWLQQIMQPDNILMSIRDAARASNVTDTQVRYWVKSGYLKTVKADNGAIKLPYDQIVIIRMIKTFLDEGYTLNGAVKKTQETKDLGRSIHHLVFSSFHNIERQGDETIFDLGPLEGEPDKHIFAIETPEKITYVVK